MQKIYFEVRGIRQFIIEPVTVNTATRRPPAATQSTGGKRYMLYSSLPPFAGEFQTRNTVHENNAPVPSSARMGKIADASAAPTGNGNPSAVE